MTRQSRMIPRVAGMAAAALAALAPVADAETKVGSTVESRILLGFSASDDAINQMLPEGWVSITLPKGPVAGSNLIVALIDRHVILDAAGKPADPSSGPIVAFLAYAKKDGVEGVRGFVTRVYEEPPLVNPYGNSLPADIGRVAGFTDAGGGDRSQSEDWSVTTQTGSFQVTLDYRMGGLMWSTGGASRPYSSVTPEFSRVYRYDQLAGLAMNTAAGRALDGNVSYEVTGDALGSLFDGSEELVSIVTIPTYVREISLP